MRRLLLALAIALPLIAGDSLVLTPGDSLSYTAPASAPWTSLGSRRIECAVDVTDWNTGGTSSDIWAFGEDLQITGADDGATVLCAANNGSANTSQNACIDVASRTTILFRGQVDYEDDIAASGIGDSGQIFLEIWDADGSDYEADIGGANNSDGAGEYEDVSGSNNVGGSATTAKILWCKQYSTTVEIGPSAPLPNPHGTGDLGDWTFNGDSLADTSSYSMTLSGSGHTFETTPTINPAPDLTTGEPNMADAPTVRAGAEVTLTGSCSSYADTAGCTCVWSDQGGGSSGVDEIQFTGSTTACTTTAVFPTFGSYTARLATTDQDANSGMRDFEVGAVAQDSTQHIVYPSENVSLLVGPQLAFGNSNWPWFEDRRLRLGNFFGPNIPEKTWESGILSGTASVTNGSDQVTGSGTDFQNDFCSGGTTPDGNNFLVRDAEGLYWRWGINSCDNATAMTMDNNWNRAPEAGLTVYRVDSFSPWHGSTDFANFYDNTLSYYSLWYATGLSRWKTYGDTNASRFWEFPLINKGRCRLGPDAGTQCSNVLVGGESMTGVMLWSQIHGTQADVFEGLEDLVNYKYVNYGDMDEPTSDIRPSGYALAWIALAHALDPDGPMTVTPQAEISALLPPMPNRTDVWDAELSYMLDNIFSQTNQDAMDGAWAHKRRSSSSSQLGDGRVTVTNGSPTVNCNDTCNFSAGAHEGKWLVFTSDGTTGEVWDGTRRTEYQVATVNSATQITLATNYAEASNNDLAWLWEDASFIRMQPFMLSFPGAGFFFLRETGFLDGRQRLVDALDFNRTRGYRPHTGGFYTFVDNAGCQAAIDADTTFSECSYTEDSGVTDFRSARYLLQEPARASAMGYKYSAELADPNAAAHKTFLDTMLGHAYGKWGGPQADYDSVTCNTCYARELEEGETTFSSTKYKNWGFGFGWGGAYTWDAIRDGLPEAENLVSYSVPLDIGGVTNAVDADVTLYEPRGFSRDVLDQTGSTVNVTGDARQGDHLARIIYRDSGGTALQTDYVMVSAGAAGPPATVFIQGFGSITGAVGFD